MANVPKDVRKPVSFEESKIVKFCSIDANILPFEKNTNKKKELVEANNKNKQETIAIDLNQGIVIPAKDMDEKTLLRFEKMKQSVKGKEKRGKVSKTGDNILSFEDKVSEREDGGQEIS